MMHCRKKLLAGGEQGYFNEKRPVNVRVEGTNAIAARFFLSSSERNLFTLNELKGPACPGLRSPRPGRGGE
jgi:hypothetical protein